MTFEESMKRLEEMSEKIKDEKTTLEEAIACYEEGMERYRECDEILRNAKQKIEIYGQGSEE